MGKLQLKIAPPFQVLLIGLAMWFTHDRINILHYHSKFNAVLASILTTVGVLLVFIAIYQFIKSATSINPLKPENATRLLTTGVFGLSRNPIYIADTLILLAWGSWLGLVLNIFWIGIFIWYITFYQIIPEEITLQQKFAGKYDKYRVQTRRWL